MHLTRQRPLATAAACAGLALALAGCGGHDHAASSGPSAVESDQRAILDVIDTLQTAGRHGDGRTICEQLFTPRLAVSVQSAAHRSCAAEVRVQLTSPDEQISVERDIRITGASAEAKISEQNGNVSTLHLLRQAGRWRIDRVLPSKRS